jgi:hypothetical protein
MKQIVRQWVKLPRRREELSSARTPAFHQLLLFRRVLRSPGVQTMTKISPTASRIVVIRNDRFTSRMAVDTVFEGKRKISPTTRTVLIPDMMMLEREAALKPAR